MYIYNNRPRHFFRYPLGGGSLNGIWLIVETHTQGRRFLMGRAGHPPMIDSQTHQHQRAVVHDPEVQQNRNSREPLQVQFPALLYKDWEHSHPGTCTSRFLYARSDWRDCSQLRECYGSSCCQPVDRPRGLRPKRAPFSLSYLEFIRDSRWSQRLSSVLSAEMQGYTHKTEKTPFQRVRHTRNRNAQIKPLQPPQREGQGKPGAAMQAVSRLLSFLRQCLEWCSRTENP